MNIYSWNDNKCVFLWRRSWAAAASPDPLRVRGMRHVCPRRLLHCLLVQLVFRERCGAERADSQRGGDADFRHRRLRGGRCARCRRRAREDVWERREGRKVSVSVTFDRLDTFDLTCGDVSSGGKKEVMSDRSDLCLLSAGWRSLRPGLNPAPLALPWPSENWEALEPEEEMTQ